MRNMDDADFASENMESFNAAVLRALRERRNERVSSGLCRSCGEEIEAERLAASPSALYCRDCAAEREEMLRRVKLRGPI
ncbi:hypothetical protein FACS1894205_0150 [Alphaproteobacteria bacterium]|nr:hypothetical protein FACS1894205_0150 [Alphaproteobacteria bacterium]